jgi:hypothetical protein
MGYLLISTHIGELSPFNARALIAVRVGGAANPGRRTANGRAHDGAPKETLPLLFARFSQPIFERIIDEDLDFFLRHCGVLMAEFQLEYRPFGRYVLLTKLSCCFRVLLYQSV